jgi:hypothetical protein
VDLYSLVFRFFVLWYFLQLVVYPQAFDVAFPLCFPYIFIINNAINAHKFVTSSFALSMGNGR